MTHIESTTQHGEMDTNAVADPGEGLGGSTPPPRVFCFVLLVSRSI